MTTAADKHSMITDEQVTSAALPVLEAMDKATENQINRKAKVFPNDRLLVEYHEQGGKDEFILECCSLHHATENTPEAAKVKIAGFEYKKAFASGVASQFLTRFPERRQLGALRYRVAATDFTSLIIHCAFPDEQIVWMDDESKLLHDYLVHRFLSQTRIAYDIAKWKADGELPRLPREFADVPDLELGDHQKMALASCFRQEMSALFMEQGTGKTPVVVHRINVEAKRKAKKEGKIYRALILCPKQVRRNWEREFERFSTYRGKVGVMRGGLLRRQRTLIDVVREEDDPHCIWSAAVMSIDSVDGTWEALKRVPFDLIVIDESHYIKNPKSQRFRAVRQFADPKFGAKMILTGSPIANSVFDLWPQLEFLAPGGSGFSSYEAFRKFHGVFRKLDLPDGSIQQLIGTKGVPLLQERLARIAFTLTKKEANLHLPDKVYDIYEVDMTTAQEKVYKKMKESMLVEIDEMLAQAQENPSTGSITVENVLTKLLRLSQITSGHIKYDEERDDDGVLLSGGEVEQIDKRNPKVEALLDLLQDESKDPYCKTVVWMCFVEDMRIVSQALHEAGIKHVGYHRAIRPEYRVADTETAAETFNKDAGVRVFLGNPASAGEGLNLLGYDWENANSEGAETDPASQTYAGHQVFFSQDWSAVKRSQAEDRVHRKGTKNNVRCTDLVVLDTIDQEIRERVMKKRKAALEIQDVRDILQSMKKALGD